MLDKNLEKLAQSVKPERVAGVTVTLIDIAGLVKNAHKGEGLGNEFLGHIREVDVIIHVIRAFEDSQVPHVMGKVDPDQDREIIKLELEIAGIKKPIIEWVNSDIGGFDRVDELIRRAYDTLDLITFYTIKGGKEVKAWSLKYGSTALEAAEKVHTDFVKKFIKTEVVNVDELLTYGSWLGAKEKGKIRLEGRDYVVQDKDVIEFKIGS